MVSEVARMGFDIIVTFVLAWYGSSVLSWFFENGCWARLILLHQILTLKIIIICIQNIDIFILNSWFRSDSSTLINHGAIGSLHLFRLYRLIILVWYYGSGIYAAGYCITFLKIQFALLINLSLFKKLGIFMLHLWYSLKLSVFFTNRPIFHIRLYDIIIKS